MARYTEGRCQVADYTQFRNVFSHHEMIQGQRALGSYFACEQPERPHCDQTCYDDGCEACLIAAQAALANGNDRWHGMDSRTGEIISLSAWVQRRIDD